MSKRASRHRRTAPAADAPQRIISGRLRGRPILYSGDPLTRPMKQRVREAIFNLIGPAVKGTYALDLFAGTGALAWEAISRGAAGATLLERHFPTARLLRQNASALGLEPQVGIHGCDTFIWARRTESWASMPHVPWLVFCCPPYALYVDRLDDMRALLQQCIQHAPTDSRIVVECDQRFDVALLPPEWNWDTRTYRPAVVALGRGEGRGER